MNGKKPWSGIIFAFVIGVIVGGLVMAVLVRSHVVHFMRGGPPRIHEVIGKRLTANIDLTTAQRQEIAGILDEYESIFRDLGQKSREEVQRAANDMEARIRAILSSTQQPTFDENARRLHDRMKKHEERERREKRR
jgi:ElaB/YqjD/DUF883 family membrane-anchored ribosome-binding protein